MTTMTKAFSVGANPMKGETDKHRSHENAGEGREADAQHEREGKYDVNANALHLG